MNQSPSEVIMVRPASFGYNLETAKDNAMMNKVTDFDNLNAEARKEFDGAVKLLRQEIIYAQLEPNNN